MSTYDVTVTWTPEAGGGTHVYEGVEYPRQSEGQLHMVKYSGVVRAELGSWHVPLVNVREWKADRR